MMKFISYLGKVIDQTWEQNGRTADSFPESAMSALISTNPADEVRPDDIISWVHHTDNFTPQMDINAQFGEPPVTVFMGNNFQIDAYFWLDDTTEIHEHSFCGAFTLLDGSSVQGIFDFEKAKSLDEHFHIGSLNKRETKTMEVGDFQAILPGARFIHNVIHLHRPTVTLLVRTSSPDMIQQYTFMKPNLSLIAFRDCSAQIKRRFQFLEMMQKLDFDRFVQQSKEALQTLGPTECGLLMLKLSSLFEQDRSVFSRILKDLYFDQADVIDVMVPVIKNLARKGFLNNLRHLVKTADHRYLGAVLSLAESRQDFLEKIALRFTGTDPAKTATQLFSEIAQIPGLDLGFGWSQAARVAMPYVLTGNSEEKMLAQFTDPEREQLAKAYQTLAANRLFKFNGS